MAFLSWSRQGFPRFLRPLIALRKKQNLSNRRSIQEFPKSDLALPRRETEVILPPKREFFSDL